jgi:hypothetical protein
MTEKDPRVRSFPETNISFIPVGSGEDPTWEHRPLELVVSSKAISTTIPLSHDI